MCAAFPKKKVNKANICYFFSCSPGDGSGAVSKKGSENTTVTHKSDSQKKKKFMKRGSKRELRADII